MSLYNNPSGSAALSICEALLLAMNDHRLLPETGILGVLRDAATTHENAARITGADAEIAEKHEVAASLINRIISSGFSVRKP